MKLLPNLALALALAATPVLGLTLWRRQDQPADQLSDQPEEQTDQLADEPEGQTDQPAGKIFPVLVGHTTQAKSLAFYPPSVRASVGDTVQFQFRPFNHTVTQAVGASAPCTPLAASAQGVDGSTVPVNSGFVPGATEKDAMVPVFNMQVLSTEPMYLYCGQPPHCNLGMVMVINPKSDADVTAFETTAKGQRQTIPPTGPIAGGTMSTIPASQAIAPP